MTNKDILLLGKKYGIDFSKVSKKEFLMGYSEELEHGKKNPKTNITNDDPVMTAKIASVHLKEDPKYYTKLKKALKSIEESYKFETLYSMLREMN
jgi:hypothetical protein